MDAFATNPFTTLPATDRGFYGRKALLRDILYGPKAIHLLGMRGTGKTSLLFKVQETEVGLWFDVQSMQGSVRSLEGMFRHQLKRQRTKYSWLPAVEAGCDLFEAIEEVAISAEQNGRSLFLFFDEAEGLEQFERGFLQQLRLLLSGVGPTRVVLATAKNISVVNERLLKWGISPIVLPLRYVAGLEDDEAAGLICQTASDTPLQVPPLVIDAIKYHTGNQPHCIQSLCGRLWSQEHNPAKWRVDEGALYCDDALTDRFRADFNYLSPLERQIVRAALCHRSFPKDLPQRKLVKFLDGLTGLGYLRQIEGKYQIGNTFLASWLNDDKSLDWKRPDRQQPSDEAAERLYDSQEQTRQVELRDRLVQILSTRFSVDELRGLCFELGVDYDDLPGEGKARKAMELVGYYERRDRIAQLVRISKQQRTDIIWPSF